MIAADNGRTHWPECWRDRTHHACAVAQVEQAEADAAQWRARYMAAHDVLLAMEYFIEAKTQTSMEQMRAAFLAYRAAVEAGAPLGWQVAEEQQPNAEAQRGEGAEEGQG